jgi:lipopolysaccharide/colanic/teichoic acid biosynthesis glycosyltransferase
MCSLGSGLAADSQRGIGSEAPELGWQSILGRLVEMLLSVLALLVLAVPMIVTGVLVRLTSPGPALFRQRRVGYRGRSFTMYKFRTMRTGVGDEMLRELIAAELRGEDTSVDGSYKLDKDPRVTPIGAFLRKTSLDELPQLINVLLGDMSLVGPRPCLEWEARMFPTEFWPRFSVRPGITGLWQVSGRSTVSTLEMLHLDLAYVRTRNLVGDLSILLRTVPSVLRDQGARCGRRSPAPWSPIVLPAEPVDQGLDPGRVHALPVGLAHLLLHVGVGVKPRPPLDEGLSVSGDGRDAQGRLVATHRHRARVGEGVGHGALVVVQRHQPLGDLPAVGQRQPADGAHLLGRPGLDAALVDQRVPVG